MSGELTAKGRATRGRIVEGAALVLRERGIEQTTLDEVMARTHTSKSQLFHYFRGGKEDLLLAVARFEAEQVLEDQQPYLGCLDSWEAWQQWREVVIKRYEEQGDRCPLASLSQHLGGSTPGARAIVEGLMHRWQEHLAVGIRALQEAGTCPGMWTWMSGRRRCWWRSRAVWGSCSRPGSPTICGSRSTTRLAQCRDSGSLPPARYRAMTATVVRPPSTSSTMPWTKADSSLAR